ncbi:hypothetical protein D8674_021583 [Pyrus ussuriensis x Pyrus communis]|uniref:Uncharacterized protein n=1 Tax=Pyrus ussuriensis x Pyrus communis TaxID=2448454 RepID=A0A5N5GHH8_9ROSA|nr:hypothetical protein D8674_021583 [Pyrus ussuriensis x Pyrus communis]
MYIMCHTPSQAGSATAISPPDMGMTGVSPVTPFDVTVSPAPASSTSSMTHPLLSARWTDPWPQKVYVRPGNELPPTTVATTSQPPNAAATPSTVDCDVDDYIF